MGGQTCLTCRNESRETIDKALVAGEPLRDIAGRTGLSKSSLDRHKKDHLSATLVKAAEASDLVRGGKLMDQVQGLVSSALASLERAEGKGNEREVQGAIREARHSLELVGRLNGDLREANRESGHQNLAITQITINKTYKASEKTVEANYRVVPDEA